MAFDSKILAVKQHFGIFNLEDWQQVDPAWILQIDGIGPATLDHIRIYLAAKNLTLKGDNTPEFWKRNLSAVKIGAIMAEEDASCVAPFTILIDSQEKQPWTFKKIIGNASQNSMPLVVPTKWKSLGARMGDYSIEGEEGHCHIERKSMADAYGTILGWGEHRERFIRELENLASIDTAAVIVECTFDQLVANAPSRGKRTAQENAKTLATQQWAWSQDFRVPWHFMANRELAEVCAFRIMERHWNKARLRKRKADKSIEDVLKSL